MVYCFTADAVSPLEGRRFFAFVRALSRCGVRCVAATPDGRSPTRFTSTAPVVDRAGVVRSLRADDLVIRQAAAAPVTSRDWLFTGRSLIEPSGQQLPLSPVVNDLFHLGISPKFENTVAVSGLSEDIEMFAWMKELPDTTFHGAETDHEVDAARILKNATVAVFAGLPPNAMISPCDAWAAGCVVLATKSAADVDLLRHGDNAWVCEPEELAHQLKCLLHPDQRVLRMQLRWRALASAAELTELQFTRHVRELFAQNPALARHEAACA